MKNKKRILLMLLTNIMLFINITNLNAIINNPASTYQTLKVLVV